MNSHPLIGEQDKDKLLADTKDKEPEEDPKDLKIAELEKERL
jgi:hypothetical protein